jgi:hypothetical protein
LENVNSISGLRTNHLSGIVTGILMRREFHFLLFAGPPAGPADGADSPDRTTLGLQLPKEGSVRFAETIDGTGRMPQKDAARIVQKSV